MRLFCTICSTDWKGRPTHNLELLSTSDDRDYLVGHMDEDVLRWQKIDLDSDNEIAKEDEEPTREEWAGPDKQWEMSQPLRSLDGRSFVIKGSDGDLTTVVYHILPD